MLDVFLRRVLSPRLVSATASSAEAIATAPPAPLVESSRVSREGHTVLLSGREDTSSSVATIHRGRRSTAGAPHDAPGHGWHQLRRRGTWQTGAASHPLPSSSSANSAIDEGRPLPFALMTFLWDKQPAAAFKPGRRALCRRLPVRMRAVDAPVRMSRLLACVVARMTRRRRTGSASACKWHLHPLPWFPRGETASRACQLTAHHPGFLGALFSI